MESRATPEAAAERVRAPWSKPRKPHFHNPLPGFDEVYYLASYPDVVGLKAGAAEHYLEHGWREGRDPSAVFSTIGYMKANPDVVQEWANPLIHFLEYGFVEGRTGWQKQQGEPAPRPQNPEVVFKLLRGLRTAS
jgi:hypothetical protein